MPCWEVAYIRSADVATGEVAAEEVGRDREGNDGTLKPSRLCVRPSSLEVLEPADSG